MKFADLHCDTPYELFKRKCNLFSNELHISLDKCTSFEKYIQIAAIWSDASKNNESCFSDFWEILEYFKKEALNLISYNKNDLLSSKQISFVIAVEDARLISDEIERLDLLHKAGVRLMTLTWKNQTQIGGSFNTSNGLTDFGKSVVHKMNELGIIPDVSHGSEQLVRDVYDICKENNKPMCATHSNSYSVYNHKRNLTDENAVLVADTGGIIGVSLCPDHISNKADINHILKHIDHYISLVGEDHIAFGCDFDGISSLPNNIKNITSVNHIYSAACQNFDERTAEKIFFNNTYNFLLNNI